MIGKITFNDVRWPHFQLAIVALFSVGVDITRMSPHPHSVVTSGEARRASSAALHRQAAALS